MSLLFPLRVFYISGLFGAKLAEGIVRCRESRRTEQDKLSHDILCEQFGTTLCSVVLVLVFSFVPYVDWAAHVGGLVAGFTVGLMVFSFRVKAYRWKCMWFTLGFVLTFLGFAISFLKMTEEVKEGVAEVRVWVLFFVVGNRQRVSKSLLTLVFLCAFVGNG